ncbi:MAG TPA: hypothetical protein VL463_21925 [Kofleriaceae bacterium]|nr:hypothetical protein [Kofleriaceae bacterium]
MAKAHWTERLQRFDRRWLFLVMGLAIIVPLIFPLGLPIKPGPMTKAAYNAVEELQPGDVALISLDLDPASTPELEPFYRAVVLQLKRKHVKIVVTTTWYQAPPLVERWIREAIEQPLAPTYPGYDGAPDGAYKKNVDYVYLGFREGREATILRMGADLRQTFDGRADDGTPFDKIPMMTGIKQLKDFKLLVDVSAGYPGAKEYVQYVQSRYGLHMIVSTTAVSLTDLTPYYQTGQLDGLVGGLAAAAQYEKLVGVTGTATAGADVLNAGHGVVILAIVLGNLVFFAGRRARKRGAA